MNLGAYWRLIRRRWLVFLIPALLVLGVGILTYSPPEPTYTVGIRFLVGQQPLDAVNEQEEDRLDRWITSEYLVFGVADWVEGLNFSQSVAERVAAQGYDVDAGTVIDALRTSVVRSRLTMVYDHEDKAILEAIADAGIDVMMEDHAGGLPQLGGEPATILALDEPVVTEIQPSITSQLDLPIRIFTALLAGLGAMLIFDFFDPVIRDGDQVDELQLPVVGQIPRR